MGMFKSLNRALGSSFPGIVGLIIWLTNHNDKFMESDWSDIWNHRLGNTILESKNWYKCKVDPTYRNKWIENSLSTKSLYLHINCADTKVWGLLPPWSMPHCKCVTALRHWSELQLFLPPWAFPEDKGRRNTWAECLLQTQRRAFRPYHTTAVQSWTLQILRN